MTPSHPIRLPQLDPGEGGEYSLEPTRPPAPWQDVAPEQWTDWRWQHKHTVRTVAQLARVLPLPPPTIETLAAVADAYRLAIPPYYLSLIDPDDPDDPIRLQAVPSPLELNEAAADEMEDPLEEEEDSPVRGLTHRYPDRVLVLASQVCPMYCRFCTRKRNTMARDAEPHLQADVDAVVQYVRDHPEVHDIIVSGGDPLMLSAARLRRLIAPLAEIDHVDLIRVGTRVPVTLPQRLLDGELVDMLAAQRKVWVQTHFNHVREITRESALACRLLIEAGIPVNNQTTLLQGVNDSVEAMHALVRGLLRIKVRPYYMFHCDPVRGAGHFRTSLWKGLEIIEGLRGHVSGVAVPTYAVDGLHGAGKVPIMPNYLVSASEDSVVLRNYEGVLFRYSPQSGAPAACDSALRQGVSGLLAGQETVLAPENTPRLQRRRGRGSTGPR